MILIKNILSIPTTILGYFYFLVIKKTPSFVYQSFVNSYCFTNGKIINLLKIIDNFFLIKEKFNYKKINSNLDYKVINNNLKKYGYYIFPYKLKKKYINDLLTYSKKKSCYYFDDFKIKKVCKFRNSGSHQNYPSSKFSYNRDELIKSNTINKIITDNNNLLIAYNYFENKPYLSNIDMWWAAPRTKKVTLKTEKANKSAQFFHFDLDRPRWLKLFIYLTDVDDYSGPHEYVEGSHKSLNKPKMLLERGYKRINSSEIRKFYKRNKIKKILGKKGTMFIADTSCFHRGIPPINKNRLLLVIEYSSSLFGAKLSNFNKKNKYFDKNSNIRTN